MTVPGNLLVTVITVVLNAQDIIERTIQSVIKQSYKNVEYIIIDGDSRDGTLDVIKKYEPSISRWVSERDRGIYDAMNKGIEMARGEFIHFLNAGDQFYEESTIERVFTNYHQDAGLVYGECQIMYPDGFSRILRVGNTSELWKRMVSSHQGLFVKKALLERYRFDLNMGLAADFDCVYKIYEGGYKFYNSGLIISSILAKGLSDTHRLKGMCGWWRVAKKHKNNLKVHLYYSRKVAAVICIGLLKKILPNNLIRLFTKYKYHDFR